MTDLAREIAPTGVVVGLDCADVMLWLAKQRFAKARGDLPEGVELMLRHGKQKELAEWANAIHKQIQLISSSRRQPTSATIWWDQPRGDYD